MSNENNRTRWLRLKEIFNGALEREGAERDEYVKQECGPDREMLNEVYALIKAHDNSGAVDQSLERLKSSAFSQMEKSGVIGKLIGPYRIVDELGYGGMGTVYLAERADGEFEQHVALKLLRTGFTLDEQIRRFRVERQILATLNHENIARLYDGGITDDGQPYFVMEHVEGKPIDEYCDYHKLALRDRLNLFLKVCNTVQYAHRKLIVHRDLKPTNIMVTDDGVVKLLDFGIAKVLKSDNEDSETIPLTQTGMLPLTPSYASPEQILGEPITTSSDMYQLGIILYELLTGIRPYELTGRTPSEIERIICEDEPTKPSTALTKLQSSEDEKSGDVQTVSRTRKTAPTQLKRTLRGELDTIVMQLLHKEPDRRYDSADQLAADIRRYLAGKPVSAHPDSWAYRSRKFVRRHRFGVAAIVIIVFLLIGYGATITWHSQQTQAALDQAQYEAEKAEQVTDFLLDMFEASDPTQALGDTITARTLLERGIGQAEQLDDRPDLQAQMFDVVGQVYGRLGMYNDATQYLENALTIREKYYGKSDRQTAMTRVHYANNIRKTGDYDKASSILEKALSIQRNILEPGHTDLAFTLSIMGGVRMTQGYLEESESLLREALDIQRHVHEEDNLDIAETLNILGLLLDEKGKLDEAILCMKESLTIRRNLLGETDPRLAISINNLAMLYRKNGEFEIAKPLYRESLEMKRTIFGNEHPSVAVTLDGIGLVLQDIGQAERAEPYLREALEIRRNALGERHPRVAGNLNNIGNYLEDRGNLEEAMVYLHEARDIFRESVGEDHPFVAFPTLGLSRILMKQNKPHEAESFIRKALEIRENALHESHWQIAEVQVYLGHCLTLQGHYQEAEYHLTEGYETLEAELGRENTTTRRALQWLVDLYAGWGKGDLAGVYLREMEESDQD